LSAHFVGNEICWLTCDPEEHNRRRTASNLWQGGDFSARVGARAFLLSLRLDAEEYSMRYASWGKFALCVSLLPRASVLPQSQPCTSVQAAPGASGYQHRSAPDRCEGIYQSPVAGESLEFMSFVVDGISYDLDRDKVLVVTVPDVSRLQATEVSVRVRALPLRVYYRMDVTVASAKAIEWPLNTTISPAGYLADSIGAIGWIEKTESKIYVPITVVPKGKPTPSQRAAVAIFRSTVEIEQVQWRLWATETTKQPPPWNMLNSNPRNMIRAGTPIRLPIAGSSQILNLELAAKPANSDTWLKTLLRVFVP
jgi:hypothetical protein